MEPATRRDSPRTVTFADSVTVSLRLTTLEAGRKTEALFQDFLIDTEGRTRDVLVMARDVPAAAPAVLTGGKS